MLKLRKQADYLNPSTSVTQVDLEGIFCASINFDVEAKELYNMTESEGEGVGSDSWLE